MITQTFWPPSGGCSTPACDVVGCVTDGTALCEAMATLQPDVIVVDLFIPPSDGFEICRHLKQVAPETPVIIVSASTDAEVGKKALRAGASAFVAKMSAVDDLLPAIQRSTATRTVVDLLEPEPTVQTHDGITAHQPESVRFRIRVPSLEGRRRMSPSRQALALAAGLLE